MPPALPSEPSAAALTAASETALTAAGVARRPRSAAALAAASETALAAASESALAVAAPDGAPSAAPSAPDCVVSVSPAIRWLRFVANCPTSLPPTSTMTPRPNWAGRPVTFIVVCMVTWVPLPEASGASDARTVADAVPAPRVSLPEASISTMWASGSRSVNFAVPR